MEGLGQLVRKGHRVSLVLRQPLEHGKWQPEGGLRNPCYPHPCVCITAWCMSGGNRRSSGKRGGGMTISHVDMTLLIEWRGSTLVVEVGLASMDKLQC